MNNLEQISFLLPIIYPSFYSVMDLDQKELVFLDNGCERLEIVDVKDKTQCEAVENHFHLFSKVGEKNRGMVLEVGSKIAENLLRALGSTFPDKKFVVYLEINVKDSTIVRFHQVWDGEPPYIDATQFEHGECHVFEFKTPQ